jgi:hypothetical protein
MSVAEWIRHALSFVWQMESSGNTEKKIQSVRAVARSQYPTADIDQMLAEIESGYGVDKNP